MGFELILPIGIIVFLLATLGWITACFYQKCGPNQAMIISGMNTGEGEHPFRVVKGGGSIVLPLIQQKDFLSLEIMTIEVHTSAPIITKAGVPLLVEGVAQVKVKGDDTSIRTAAEQFLGKSDQEIANIAHETLVGHLRAMLGTMDVEELIQNFDAFASRVQEVSLADLAKMGLTVVSFTIKEIKDSVGYLDALGRRQTAETKRDAEVGEANAQRDAQIARAQAAEEGAKAKLAADTRVAESSKNFQLSQAKYQAEVAAQKAQSDMAYDIVKAQQQQLLVQETQKIRILEAQKAVELQSVEVQRKQVELESQITKPAEAEQTRIKLIADAEAQAAKLKASGEAEATKIKALAEAEATKSIGVAQAESNKAQGLAEAAVVAARGQAEAEAMAKKAEAFKQYNQAAIASMIVEKMPEVVSAMAEPMSKIGNLTVLTSDSSSTGASRVTADVMNVAAQSMTMIKGLTGFDLSAALQNNNTSALKRDGNNAAKELLDTNSPEQKQEPNK